MNVLTPYRKNAKDFEKAKKEAYDKGVKDGMHATIHCVLMVVVLFLGDKRGWLPHRIAEAIRWISKTTISIQEGYTSFPEIEEAVRQDYGIYYKNGEFFFDEGLIKS